MEIWLTEKQKQETTDKNVHEYVFEFHVWVVCSDTPVIKSLNVDGQNAGSVSTATEEKKGYYRAGSVKLPRGRHLISINTEQLPERLLLSEDKNIVSTGKAQILWDNRGQGELNLFEERKAVLSEENRKLLVKHGFLFENEHDAELGNVPSGVPFGGIGAGKVELTPEGFFTALTFNNNQDSPVYRLPGCYFAVQSDNGKKSVTRLLQTVSVGQLLKPVSSIDSDMSFPEADLTYNDPELPVKIKLHAFSSHIPNDPALSGLPCIFFRFTIENSGKETCKTRLVFSWENLINVGGSMVLKNQNQDNLFPLVYHTWNHSFVWSCREAGVQSQSDINNGTGLKFSAKDDRENSISFGDHFIWTPSADNAEIVLDRDMERDEESFSKWLESGCPGDKYTPKNVTAQTQFHTGAVIVAKDVAPGKKETVDFVLAWYMPNYIDPYRKLLPNYYTNKFSSVEDVVGFAWKQRDALLSQTREIREILKSSSLPGWFQKQLLDCRFVANTNTIFLKDGSFSVNEGPTGMSGCLGTLDQRTGSGAYWTVFFPELDAKELYLFTLRQEDTSGPVHDLGFSGFNLTKVGSGWPDLGAAYIIQVHRHFLRTGDMEFLKYHWQFVRRTVEWMVAMDDTGDCVPTLKPGRGTTYDNQHWDGISAFVAGMFESSMVLAVDIAGRIGEQKLAGDWQKIAEKAHESRMKYLWVDEKEGGYFRNAYDIVKKTADDSCFIASMVDEWAVCSGGFKPKLSADKIRQALEGIFRKNIFKTGMADQSSRPDNRVFMQYPVAYYGAAALYTGNADIAWDFLKFQDKLITTPPSSHYNQTLTFTSDGKPAGLPYYMTAPVSWLFLDGISGFVPDVIGKSLRIAPCWKPGTADFNVPVFTTTSWFMVNCREEKGKIIIKFVPVKQVKQYKVEKVYLSFPMIPGKEPVISSVSFDPGIDKLEIDC